MKVFVFIATLIISFSVKAQYQFVHISSTIENEGEVRFSKIVEKDDSSFVIFSSAYLGSGFTKPGYYEVNKFGEKHQAGFFNFQISNLNYYLSQFISTGNGGYYIYGSNNFGESHSTFVDSDYSIIQNLLYMGDDTNLVGLITIKDSIYFTFKGEKINESWSKLSKWDLNTHNLIYSNKTYNQSDTIQTLFDIENSFQILSNKIYGNFIRVSKNNSQAYRCYIGTADSDSLEFTYTDVTQFCGENKYYLQLQTDSLFVFTNYNLGSSGEIASLYNLNKLDTINSKYISDLSGNFNYSFHFYDNNGNTYVYGVLRNDLENKNICLLLEFDSTGTFKYYELNKTADGEYHSLDVKDIIRTIDGGFALTCRTVTNSTYGVPHYFIKTDSLFQIDDKPFYNTTLGLEDETSKNNVNVFPNPTTSHFTIQSSSNIKSLMVYNLHGQQLLQKSNLSATSFTVEEQLPSGVYVVKVETAEGVEVRKVLVQ